MARTAEKIESLVAEDSEMEAAIETVLETAEAEGTVEWGDVSDDISSGQWGRLLQENVLVDADDGKFVVEDPEGVREALDETEPESEDGGGDWTIYDKVALVGTVGLFVGYANQGVRNAIGTAIDPIFAPLADHIPFYMVIIVLATVTGFYSTILQDKLTNMEGMSEYQQKAQELKERRKKAKERDDDEELERIQQEQMEMMGENMGMMKAQMRPMPWIMVLTIPVFLWMYWMILDGHIGATSPVVVFPIIGDVPSWTAGVIGPFQAWIFWYFICSMSLSQIIRKALNVQTSPT